MKQINKKEWEISSSSAIVDYIIKNGFENIVTLEKGKDNKSYVFSEDKMYALIEKVEGEKFALSTHSSIVEFSEVLGNFHNAAQGFAQPPGIKVKALWGKSIERYRTMTNNLEKYNKNINLRGPNNRFERVTATGLDNLLKRAKASIKIFRSVGYLRTLENSMIKKEICLNTISDNIAVKSTNGIIITNIFDLGYNMIEEDLGNLIKKGIETTGDKLLYKEAIKKYSKIRNLEDNSIPIIKAIITFPYDTLRIINRYINKKEDENILIDKYKKYYEREHNCEDIWGGM